MPDDLALKLARDTKCGCSPCTIGNNPFCLATDELRLFYPAASPMCCIMIGDVGCCLQYSVYLIIRHNPTALIIGEMKKLFAVQRHGCHGTPKLRSEARPHFFSAPRCSLPLPFSQLRSKSSPGMEEQKFCSRGWTETNDAKLTQK